MWPWHKKEKKPLLEQLIEARANVCRQLVIMGDPPMNPNTKWQEDSIKELERTLSELDKRIAELRSGTE